jgi:exopolysaccharide biosynthesis polyprenyl glycosylphosphotransferase
MKRLNSLLWPALDVVLILIASALAWYLRYEVQLFRRIVEPGFYNPLAAYTGLFSLLTVTMLIALSLNGAYTPRRGSSLISEVLRIFNASLASIFIVVAVTFGLRSLVYSRLLFFYDGVLIVFLLGAARAARRQVEAQLRRHGYGVERVLIVGAGEVGRAVMRTMVARPDLGYQVVGFVDDDPVRGSTDVGRFRALGGLDDVESLLVNEKVDDMIITLPWMYQRKIAGLVSVCQRLGVRPRVAPDLFQPSLSQVDVDDLGGIPLIGIKEHTLPRSVRLVKRLMDIVITVISLILLSPFLALVAILIKLDSPGPAFFKQKRIGQGGRPFEVIKFRSMKKGAEEEVAALAERNEATGPLFKIKDDPRLTRLGRFLRRMSIDELPQLLNVLRGEMSIVGPRPALPDEVEKYETWQRQRLEVPQGITGLPQVSGRSDLTFDEMCLLDVYYIENWSLALDVTIMLRTIPQVLFGNGAY